MYTRYLRLFLVLISAICFVFAFHIFSLFTNPASAREALASQSARPREVVINELVIKGKNKWVELYNSTRISVPLRGWYVTDMECNAAITNTLKSNKTITAGGYVVIDEGTAGDNLTWDPDGAVITLCEGENPIDSVAYGNQGGAPLAHTGDAIARVPNERGKDGDAWHWNIAPDPTKGEENNAAGVALGTTLVINEIEGGSGLAYPRIELYNPTSSTITVTDWLHSDGDITPKALTTKTAVIAPGEFFVFRSSTRSIGDKDVVYLFMPNGTRVDQVAGGEGFNKPGYIQRVPDGAGPHDGYDWPSSGGDASWFKLPTTLGKSNARRLDISKSGPTTAVAPGDKVPFTLTYGNPLSETAHNVVITEILPTGVSYAGFVTYTAELTLTQTTPPVWEVGTIMSHTTGITFTVWVTFTESLNVSPLENVVWIDSATIGFIPVSTTHTVEVLLYDPDLAIEKTVTPTMEVALNDIVTYTIVLSNSGQGIAKGVVMTDPLTPCVDFGGWITVDRDQDSVTMPPPDIKWGPWDIPGDTAYTLAFTATVTDDSACASAPVTNTAYFASTNAGADAAQAVFTVAEPPVNRIFLPLVLRD